MREVAQSILGPLVPDVTRDKVLQQALSRVEELVTAERRKDEFLATLSHELRSPLGAICQAVRILSSEKGDALARQRAQALIERQVRRMTQLVDGLLDISRICHGQMHLQRERLDLRVIVGDAIETLDSEIRERHHQLITLLPDEPIWLHADPLRLEQVFVNLLTNASKYMDSGGKLEVWVHRRDALAVVRVRDSGIGIGADDLPHVFDLFKQVDSASPRSQSGLGVGLSLVRELVDLHGGSVIAASRGMGHGSEFTVRLPVAK
jgi:signal transduction histidine kinase